MFFRIADYIADSEALLKVIEDNNRKAIEVRGMIENFKVNSVTPLSISEEKRNDTDDFLDTDSVEYADSEFEGKVAFFLEGYRQLDVCFSLDDLIAALPSPSEYDYKDILMRLSLESVKEIKELTEILIEEDDSSQKDQIKIYIDNEKIKISMLRELLNSKDNANAISAGKVHNTIILAPTSTGNIKILDDLDHVAIDYLPMFRELIDSIIDGTFKRIKRFTDNNVLNGICEVRSAQARILFQRVGKNSYALINAFVKKGERDRGYQEFIKFRVTDYKSIASKLKAMLNESEFIAENEKNIDKLNKILGSTEKAPTYKKEVQ